MNGKLYWNKLHLVEFPNAIIQLHIPIELYGWADINNPILQNHMLAAIRKQLDKQGLPWGLPTAYPFVTPFNWKLLNQVETWGDAGNLRLYTCFTIYLGDPELSRRYQQVLGNDASIL